jgi:hypothetical protein
MARSSNAKSQHVILDVQGIVFFVTFVTCARETRLHFVCSEDADAGLDEGEIVRVAHMYRVVAGDSVSRSHAQLEIYRILRFYDMLLHRDFYDFYVVFLLQYCLKVQYRCVAGAGTQCRRKSLIFERRLCPVLTRPRFSDCKLDDSFGGGTELVCGGKQQLRF